MTEKSRLIFRHLLKSTSWNICRHFTTRQQVVHLDSRTLIQISGKDSSTFLQGLITNDMRHLDNGNASIYALFLNTKGRVIYDTIVYKIENNNLFYLECDTPISNELRKYLLMYKLRKKLEIELLTEKMKIWTIFNPFLTSKDSKVTNSTLRDQISSRTTQDNKSREMTDKILAYEDPRLQDLGIRILSENNVSVKDITQNLGIKDYDLNEEFDYRIHRYKLGVGEGTRDFPPGKCLPLEINADYLHGISFHKGCYIGQELTARIHHTGIVRKRLMPLIFDNMPDKLFNYDEKIYNEHGDAVGKFKGQEKTFALGLMRIEETLKAKSLKIQEVFLKAVKPLWWMLEDKK